MSKKLSIKHYSEEDFRVLYHGGANYAIVVGWTPWAGALWKIRDHHKELYKTENNIKNSDYIFQRSYRRNGRIYWEEYKFPPKIRNNDGYLK